MSTTHPSTYKELQQRLRAMPQNRAKAPNSCGGTGDCFGFTCSAVLRTVRCTGRFSNGRSARSYAVTPPTYRGLDLQRVQV